MREQGLGGFTLLELLVAIALMAVLAVLCWRGLDGVLRSRDRIGSASDELRALTVAFSQMDEDLRASWPVRLLNVPGRPSIRFLISDQGAPAVLDLLRETGSRDERLRLQRVIYRVRAGRLERGFGPFDAFDPSGAATVGTGATAAAADSAAAGGATLDADASIIWQPLLTGVAAIDFRVWLNGRTDWAAASTTFTQGANSGSAAAAAAAAAAANGSNASGAQQAAAVAGAAAALPDALAVTGVEITLARTDRTRLVRVFALKD
jgi:general secretion pathway protein J